MTPQIRALVQAYRDALDEVDKQRRLPGAYHQGQPDAEVEHAERAAAAAGQQVADAVLALLDEEPLDPGRVDGITIHITDAAKALRELFGAEAAAQLSFGPLLEHDYRFEMITRSDVGHGRAALHQGASMTAEDFLRYAAQYHPRIWKGPDGG